MAKRLYYFDLKGIGEGIRYLLHYGEVEFEDVRIAREDWPNLKKRSPFGKLPVYKDGDIVLHQTIVIARYIGGQLGLVLENPLDDAKASSVIHTLFDFFGLLKDFFNEPDEKKKEELKVKILVEHVPFYFSKFDKQLHENNGHFGNQLSWADILFVAMLDAINDLLAIEIQKQYENVDKLFVEVRNFKGIKAYLQNSKK